MATIFPPRKQASRVPWPAVRLEDLLAFEPETRRGLAAAESALAHFKSWTWQISEAVRELHEAQRRSQECLQNVVRLLLQERSMPEPDSTDDPVPRSLLHVSQRLHEIGTCCAFASLLQIAAVVIMHGADLLTVDSPRLGAAGVLHGQLAEDLQNRGLAQLQQLLATDVASAMAQKNAFHTATREHVAAISRYARVKKKRVLPCPHHISLYLIHPLGRTCLPLNI